MTDPVRERRLLACLVAARGRPPFRWWLPVRVALFAGTVLALLLAKRLVLAAPSHSLVILGGVLMWGALVGIALLAARRSALSEQARAYLDYDRIEARLGELDAP